MSYQQRAYAQAVAAQQAQAAAMQQYQMRPVMMV